MKKLLLLAASVAALSALAIAGPAVADNYGPTACGGGKMIVNVTYRLTNDADSGTLGQTWALDDLDRHMQIFDLGAGVYCYTINDTGSFVTTGAVSPQNGQPLSAGIKGVINGGYVTTHFTAMPKATADYATKGNLGTFDANGAHPSYLSYLTDDSGWGQPSWGWTYHTAKNGDWTNASAGNSGDITG